MIKKYHQIIWHKELLFLLPLVVVAMVMSLKVSAAEVTTGTLGDSNGITWIYDPSENILTITGEDSGVNGSWDNSPFANICSDVEHIVLKDCTLIGDTRRMFVGLTSLKSVKFEGKVDTTYVTDMSYMFYNCRNLKSLDLGGFDTRNVRDMSYMFYHCSNLTSLDLSNFDTRNVRDMSHMFYYCNNLTSLDLSNFDTRNVTGMDYMFCYCNNLTSLDLGNFDTGNVTNMNHMFYDCRNLKSLDFNTFDTKNVKNMDSMFCACNNLISLDLSNFDTRNVNNMRCMFRECSNLISLDLSDFDTRNVNNIDEMFFRCSKLTSLDLSSFDTTYITQMDNIFFGSYNLDSIYTPRVMTNRQSIELPRTFYDSQGNRVSTLTLANCNKILKRDWTGVYIGNINSELISFDLKKNENGAYYFTGQIVVVEWVDGVSTVPKDTPSMIFKSTDGTEQIEVFVTPTGTNTYYFDRFIEGLSMDEEYVFEIASGTESNCSPNRSMNVLISTSPQIVPIKNLGKIGEQKISYYQADNGELRLYRRNTTYVGNINSELIKTELVKGPNGNYVSGQIVVVEWENGVSTVPFETPIMYFKSTDGLESLPVFVTPTGTNTYYFDRSLGDMDTSKEYIFSIASGDPLNVSPYRSMVVTTAAMQNKSGTLWESETQYVRFRTDVNTAELRIYAVDK